VVRLECRAWKNWTTQRSLEGFSMPPSGRQWSAKITRAKYVSVAVNINRPTRWFFSIIGQSDRFALVLTSCREGEVVERNQMLIELQPVTGEDS
jgi:hypothetical protein